MKFTKEKSIVILILLIILMLLIPSSVDAKEVSKMGIKRNESTSLTTERIKS